MLFVSLVFFVFLESNEEIMMNKIQEIVKKVSCLPSGICAETSGAEVSEHSPWILRELNRCGNVVY